ncbi:MAG: dihydroneopterin aldolase [Sphingomonadales bacterium]|nr:dihydroneopterin aldolase [Sphingomonadales bacterium]
MPGLLTIKVEGLRFYSYHGLYPEERKEGGEYQVDLQVVVAGQDQSMVDIATGRLAAEASTITPLVDLEETIDYEQLFSVVKEEMAIPRDLLETLAMSIVKRITAAHACQQVVIEIKKFRVPVENFSGNTAVRYEWNR